MLAAIVCKVLGAAASAEVFPQAVQVELVSVVSKRMLFSLLR